MRGGLPRPTPSAVAMVLQVASLLGIAGGLVVILISDNNNNRHKSATAKVEPPGFVSLVHR
jgi:hypothetical protein